MPGALSHAMKWIAATGAFASTAAAMQPRTCDRVRCGRKPRYNARPRQYQEPCPRLSRVPVSKPAQSDCPALLEIAGNDKKLGQRCPHCDPRPWSGSPVWVRHCGNLEAAGKLSRKQDHGGTALKTCQQTDREVWPTGEDDRVCARKGLLSWQRGLSTAERGDVLNRGKEG